MRRYWFLLTQFNRRGIAVASLVDGFRIARPSPPGRVRDTWVAMRS